MKKNSQRIKGFQWVWILGGLLAVSSCGGSAGAAGNPQGRQSNGDRTTPTTEQKNPSAGAAREQKNPSDNPADANTALERAIRDWPARPLLAVRQMTRKYGTPQDVSVDAVVWQNPAPFKRIKVSRVEIPHDFPKPHMDFVEHTIAFDVPRAKIAQLAAFDSSVIVDRTPGELSARCDLEAHNILSLNLAQQIINGDLTVAAARRAFNENIVEELLGKHPRLEESLRFDLPKAAGFTDQPTLAGAPRRDIQQASAGTDAEILATLLTADENEIRAAVEVEERGSTGPALDFAKKMHVEHGQNLSDAMALSEPNGINPAETKTVDALAAKGAGELASIVNLNGAAFDQAYLSLMVKQHQEVLDQLDTQLIPKARNESLKKLLLNTRQHVEMHLELAKKLQRQ